MSADNQAAWTTVAFEAQLSVLGRFYHIHHPCHVLMNDGSLDRPQIQAWVANRYYYQISIPLKDAAILSNCPDREVRRLWIQRVVDHDGRRDKEGGIEAWIRLAEACSLPREELISLDRVLPGVRFAVDAYVNFARTAPWQEAVCSSLPSCLLLRSTKNRLDNWPKHYP